MKRIQFYMKELRYGGIEKQVFLLANALSDIFSVEIIILGKKEMFQLNLHKKIKLVELSLLDYKNNIWQRQKLKNQIKKLTTEEKVDVIISTDILFHDFFGHLSDSVNIIYWEHTFQVKALENTKKCLRSIKHVVVPNSYIQEYYSSANVSVSIIPFAIESRDMDTLIHKGHNIIAIGKLEKDKHYDEMLEVMEKVAKDIPDVKLYIIGDGPERIKLSKLVTQKKLDKNVIFSGFLESDEVEKLLKQVRLIIGTREKESFGVSFLEAMRFGLPCVSFEFLALHEIIKDDINGYLIKNRNKVEMANRIVELLKNDKLCVSLGNCSKEMSVIYEIQSVKSEWLKIL